MQYYQAFAPIYDSVVGSRKRATAQLLKRLRALKPRPLRILEIGCGTGSVLKILQPHFEVVGLDLSKKMLQIARNKLPGIELHHATMSQFDLNTSFDAVICVFDTINHLRTWKEWVKTFESVRAHLSPKGHFLFDLHTAYGLKQAELRTPWLKQLNSGGHVIMDVVCPRKHYSEWSVRMFTPLTQNRYRMKEDVIREISFPVTKLRQELKKHFSEVTILEARTASAAEKLEKIHFLCKR